MSSFKLSRAEAAALLSILLLVSSQLMWPPMVGLANNGDFGRMAKWGALGYAEPEHDDIFFNWVNRKYKFVANPSTTLGSWPSSEVIFVKVAAVLGYWFVSDQSFDLRLLGLIHILAFLLSFLMLMRGIGAGSGFSCLFFVPWFALIFCDLSYTLYFHSLYTEPASLIFLLATVGSGLYLLKQKPESMRRAKAILLLLLFGVCSLLLIGVKTQNVIFAPVIAIFGLRLLTLNGERLWQNVALTGVFVVTLLALGGYALTPASLKNSSKYNAIFLGALLDSPDSRRDLRDLGVSEEYSALVGTNYHQPDLPINIKSEEFQEGYYRKIGFSKILFFYLQRPGRFLDKLQKSLNRGYVPRPEYAGNFEKSSGERARAQSHRWNHWGLSKKHYFPKSVWFLAAYLAAIATIIFVAWRKSAGENQKLVWEFYFALLLMIPVTLVTSLLGDGFSDFERHMLTFNVLMDLSLLLILGHLTAFIFGKLTGRQVEPLTASAFPA